MIHAHFKWVVRVFQLKMLVLVLKLNVVWNRHLITQNRRGKMNRKSKLITLNRHSFPRTCEEAKRFFFFALFECLVDVAWRNLCLTDSKTIVLRIPFQSTFQMRHFTYLRRWLSTASDLVRKNNNKSMFTS